MKVIEAFNKKDLDQTLRKSVNYIHSIAESTGDLSPLSWDLSLFTKADGSPVTSAREINKIYFAKLKEKPHELSGEVPEDVQRDIINTYQYSAALDPEVASIRSTIRQLESNLRGKYSDLTRRIQRMESDTTISSRVIDVLKKGVWDFVRSEDLFSDWDWALRSPPIFVTHQGTTLNMGRYLFRPKLDSRGAMYLEVYQNKRKGEWNANYSGFIHFFVGSQTEICYGESGTLAVRLMADKNLEGLLELTLELLKSYHPNSNPYVRFDRFRDFAVYPDNTRMNGEPVREEEEADEQEEPRF